MSEPKSAYIKTILTILTAIGLILTIMISIILLNYHVDNRVQKIVASEEFIDKVVSKVHPYVIFDENESIINNMGAMDYIDDIKVNKGTKKAWEKSPVPIEIIVIPNTLLHSAPYMTCIDQGDVYVIIPSRGKKYNWIYDLDLQEYNTPRKVNRFRLEILR